MDFTESETQAELAGLARKIFTERTTASGLAETESGDDRFDPALWADLATAGVLSAALPESLGGAGLGPLEQCSVLIEAGATVAPVPYLASIVLGAGSIAKFGTAGQARTWAAPAGHGELILTAALEEGPCDAARLADGGWRLDGEVTTVPFAQLASLFLVPAATPDGERVFLLEPGDAGVSVERQQVTSGGSAGLLTLDGVTLGPDRILGDAAAGAVTPAGGSAGGSVADWLRATAAVGVCAHQAGVIAKALALTAAYTRTREQFGKPVGAFQAVTQRLADGYIDAEAIRLTMWQAAWRLAEGLPAAAEIATAKFWAADGGHRVAHTAVHLHGGVGIDTEARTHRYFTAAKQNEFALGGATAHLLRLGAALA